MDTGKANALPESLETLSQRVREMSKELASDIARFLEDNPKKDSDNPTPILSALDQLFENLHFTENNLKESRTAFVKLTNRIRS